MDNNKQNSNNIDHCKHVYKPPKNENYHDDCDEAKFRCIKCGKRKIGF